MKWIPLKDKCQLEGCSTTTGRRKVKSGEWTYKREGQNLLIAVEDGSAPEALESMESLKRRKTKAEAIKIEMQNQDVWRMRYFQWEQDYISEFLKAFAPLRETIRGFGLDKAQVDFYNDTLDECAEDLKKRANRHFEQRGLSDE